MKIYLATDHAGFSLKEVVKRFLLDKGYEVEDCGAYSFDKDDDFPDFISKAADGVSKSPDAKAIIFGSSGQGEAIAANKYPNVRAVVFYGPYIPVHNVDVTGRISTDPYEMIRVTREHNDANVLSLGAKFIGEDDAIKVVEMWLGIPFTKEERHMRRIEKIKAIEKNV